MPPGLGLIVIGIALEAIGFLIARTGASLPDLNLANRFLLAGLGAFLMAIGFPILSAGRKARAGTAADVRAGDTRAPVVYLRSFADDAKAAQSVATASGLPFMGASTEEEQLARAMQPIGPVIAIGRPGEALPELGAARLYLDEDAWRPGVRRLLLEARLVVVRAGGGRGLRWEFQTALEMVKPERLLLLVPTAPTEYESFAQDVQDLLPRGLPSAHRASRLLWDFGLKALIYFEPDWTPRYVRLKAPPIGTGNFTVTPSLTMALRPVFEQQGVQWTRPPVQRRMLSLAVAGLVAVAAFMIWAAFFYRG